MSTLLLSQIQRTPAHHAAMDGEVEVLELLQEHGTRWSLVDSVSAAYTVYYTVHNIYHTINRMMCLAVLHTLLGQSCNMNSIDQVC